MKRIFAWLGILSVIYFLAGALDNRAHSRAQARTSLTGEIPLP